MNVSSLRRWCKPRTILIISSLSENPAHTLDVVNGFRGTGARLFLVQLPVPSYSMGGSDRPLPFLVRNGQSGSGGGQVDGNRQAFLWAEILSEVTVLKNMAAERIRALVDSLGADLVVMSTPLIGTIRYRAGSLLATNLFCSLPVPIMIFGSRMDVSEWDGNGFRRILMPISFRPELDLHIRFACRFARRHHGRLTVLHVYEGRELNEHPWERTPVAVESCLPISALKREGIMCSMAITVSEGYPAAKILRFNQQKPHDLIILGGPSQWKTNAGMGRGVAEAVIAEAPCPVLMLGKAMESASAAMESIAQLTLA